MNRNHEPCNVYRIVKTDQKVKVKLTTTEVNRWTEGQAPDEDFGNAIRFLVKKVHDTFKFLDENYFLIEIKFKINHI